MGEMADVIAKPLSQSGSVELSMDAEPVTPRYQHFEGITNNFYSNDLSQDAIAGVPPRSRSYAAPVQPRVPPLPRQPSAGSQDTQQHIKSSYGSTVQIDENSFRNSRARQVTVEADIKDEDSDSSYGSYSSSMESCSLSPDWEAELEQYKEKMPTEIRESYYDAVVLYTEDDRNDAEIFRQHLIHEIKLPHNETVLALLYDCPELHALSGSQLQQLDKAMERSTYVFVYLTAKFVKDKWCEFSSESCLMRAIYDEEKRWCVVPVYTERRTDCKFKIPMGLNSLKGINYYSNDEFYRKGVARLIGDKVAERKRLQEEHKIKQKEWVERYKRDLIKLREQKRRTAQHEEMKSRDFHRKVEYLPDSDLFNNQQAKMHNSFSESQLSNRGYSLPHSASMGSLKGIQQQNPAVAQILEDYKNNFKYTTQRSYTHDEVELVSRILEEERRSHPDPISGKFQGLNIRSPTSNCSADMGIQSEANEGHGEVDLNIRPEVYAYLRTLDPDQRQYYLDHIYASQQGQQIHPNQSGGPLGFTDRASPDGYFSYGPGTSQNQTDGIPNLDTLLQASLQSQHHYSHSSKQSGESSESSGSYSSGSSSVARPEMSSPVSQRTMEQSQGNVPTYLAKDYGSTVFEDSGSMPDQHNDWTLVDREQVPQMLNNKADKQGKPRKDGKKHKQTAEPKEIEMVEKTSKQGQIVHQTIYHIYNPKAVQIGDENLVQDASGNPLEDKSDPDSDTETAVKVHSEKSAKDKRSKKKEKEIESEEEIDSHENMKPLIEPVPEQIHGEISDVQHNSGGIVAMDAAPSSAGSYMNSEGPTTGQDEYKNDLSAIREEPVSYTTRKQNQQAPVAKPTIATPGNRGPKPKIPVKPLPHRDELRTKHVNDTDKPKIPVKPLPRRDELPTKHVNDTDQTLVKPSRVVLPNKPFSNNDSDQSDNCPSVVKKVFARPMAKIGPCIFKNNNDDDNTDPKTVINSEETALKCPYVRNNMSEETRLKTVEGSSDSSEDQKTIVQHESEKTLVRSSADGPSRRSIQSLMPLGALARSEQSFKIEERKEMPQGDNTYQAPPFSIFRHSDASTLFYRNRFDTVEPAEVSKQDNMVSIDDSEASTHNMDSFDLSETGCNHAGLYHEEVPLGEDPLTRAQESETLGFIPNETELDTDAVEYDLLEDSTDEVSSSSESQKKNANKLSRFFNNLRGKFN